MRWSVIAVVLAYFCLVESLTPFGFLPALKPVANVCTSDNDCKPYCFCLKGLYHYHGSCQCAMDPDYLKPSTCLTKFDCEESKEHHPGDLCDCVREGHEYFGVCKCQAPLLLGVSPGNN